MKVQKKLNISMSGNELPRPVKVVATNSAIQLILRYVDFTIPDGTTATLYARKPSGKFVYQTTGITISGNVVTVNLENQVIMEDGIVPFQVELKNGTDTLTTFSNHFLVDRNYKNSDAEKSEIVITEFEKLLQKAQTASGVGYDDSETKLGADNVQAAIGKLSGQIGNQSGTGLSAEAIDKLEEVGNHLAFISADGGTEWKELIAILKGGSSGGEEPDTPEVTLSSISATYSGGSVLVGTSVNDLTGIVVTARYSDGTTKTVTGYTLSGTIAEGSNTVTISYGGKSTTITVIGYAEDEEEITLSSISATYTGGDVPVGTSLTDLTGITVKGHYSDGSTANITGYTLSGTIAEGSNTITVSYNSKTATFTVVGVAESGGGETNLQEINLADYLVLEDYKVTGKASDYNYMGFNTGSGHDVFQVPIEAGTYRLVGSDQPEWYKTYICNSNFSNIEAYMLALTPTELEINGNRIDGLTFINPISVEYMGQTKQGDGTYTCELSVTYDSDGYLAFSTYTKEYTFKMYKEV